MEFANKKSKLTLDADTLINLCVYVLLKAQCIDIYGHLKLANQFATNQIRNSKLGYVSSTIEVSIEQILTLEDEHILPTGETIDCDFDRSEATVASSINFEALDQAKINRKMSITGWRVA